MEFWTTHDGLCVNVLELSKERNYFFLLWDQMEIARDKPAMIPDYFT